MIKAIATLGFLQVLLLFSLSAQQLTLSPYSRYAIGEILQPTTARNEENDKKYPSRWGPAKDVHDAQSSIESVPTLT